MKKGFIILIFLLSFLIGCAGNEKKEEEIKYIFLVSSSVKSMALPGESIRIPINLRTTNTDLDWQMCLSSFNSYLYNVKGDRCIQSSEVSYSNNETSFLLPKNGEISISKDINNDVSEDIITNLCYKRTDVFILDGKLSKGKEEVFSIKKKNLDSPINILYIKAYYDIDKNVFILVGEISIGNPSSPTVIDYYLTDKNLANERDRCYLDYVNTVQSNIEYTLKYYTSKYTGEIKGSLIGRKGDNIPIIIQTNINEDLPMITMQLEISYNVLERHKLGTIIIKKI